MREILQGRLWIGNARNARDPQTLFAWDISAVVDLAANETPAMLPREFVSLRIPLIDGEEHDASRIALAIRSLVALLDEGFRVLVACSAGISRSPAIAAAAMSLVTKTPPEDSLLEIAQSGPHDVSPAFWNSVRAVLKRS